MTYTNKELLNKVMDAINESEKKDRQLKVLTRLIIKSLSQKTLDNLSEKGNIFLFKVEDFNGDLNYWLDKGLTFDDIIELISREIGSYVNDKTKSDL